MKLRYIGMGCFAFLALGPAAIGAPAAAGDWAVYGGDPGGTRWSPLKQVTVRNVRRLTPAWVYRCDDMRTQPRTTIECNPLIVDGTMYVGSPTLKVIALDPETGRERWVFDPWQGQRGGGVSRGFAFWKEGEERRLFTAARHHLIALDPATGLPVKEFGTEGRIDLREQLDRELVRQSIGLTTPGVIYKDLIIVGSQVDDSPTARAPGHIRAFDVRTGQRRWIFHTIPQPGEAGYETWPPDAWKTAAACNAWGGLTLDAARGLVFCGTGSPAYDHYGGDRVGANWFGNCVLALDAATGVRRWHFQVVHHDLWDYDLPCPPVLVEVNRAGRKIAAAAQATKTGHLFLFERETGKPIFPIVERPVPASELPGEAAWPTQPFPSAPPPFARQGFTDADVTDLSPAAAAGVREQLRTIRPAPLFQPPGLTPHVVAPQFNGGAEWGGQAFDPETGLLYVNSSNEPEWMSMTPASMTGTVSLQALGEHLFGGLCAQCHGSSKGLAAGTPPPPSLDTVSKRLSRAELLKLLETGRGQMPSFGALTDTQRGALAAFLFGDGREQKVEASAEASEWANRIRYLATGHHDFRDPEGFPVNRRPWGTLTAIDVSRGNIRWQTALGTYPVLEKRGLPPTGTFNIGGPIVTAGGLVFIGATRDERLHAYHKRTGELVWEFQLDAGGYATPATYEVRGRQYVVIAAGGGGKPETKPGNAYWAFALPK